MTRMALAGVGILVRRFDVHAPHERDHILAANRLVVLTQHVSEHPDSGKRMVHVQFVNFTHELQIRLSGLLMTIVGSRRARERIWHCRVTGNA